jgi:two-component system sensor histidine kinase/response regulator
MDDLPIIFLSAESERESILKGFEAGAQDYVTKPFDSRELLARVRTQLDLKSKTEKLLKINEWLGKKIDKWLKESAEGRRSMETFELSDKLIEFDKNQSSVLKNICLELNTSLKEIEKYVMMSNDSNFKGQLKKILKRITDLVVKLEKV